MYVILLENVAKLGVMGQTVKVKPGYARNFLLPTGKALRATKENLAKFEMQKAQLEARDLARRQDAQEVASRLEGTVLTSIRSAAETGQLYGSVATRDLVELLKDAGFIIARSQLHLSGPIKTTGIHSVVVQLHADIQTEILLNVARSADEAKKQLEKIQPAPQEEEVTTEVEAVEENANGEEA